MKKRLIRLLCLALALLMTVLCCACGEHEEAPDPDPDDSPAELVALDGTMTDIAFVGDGIASFKDTGSDRLGLIDSSGKVIVAADYAAVKFCAMEGYCILTKSDGSEYTYNPDSGEITEGNLCAHGGYAEFFWDAENEKVVYYEIEAEEVPKSDLPEEGDAQIIYDLKTLKVGLVGHDGKLILEPTYDAGLHFTNGLAALKKGGKWGYVNAKGEEVIGFYYDAAYTSVACVSFGEGLPYNADSVGLIVVARDGLYGIYNRAGDIACSFQYRDMVSFGDGKYAGLRTDGKWVLGNLPGIDQPY